jgi:hypothetical protein
MKTCILEDYLIEAAKKAVKAETNGVREVRDVLHAMRAEERRSVLCYEPKKPQRSSQELQLRAHAVDQILMRDFCSGLRGENLKDWAKSFYVVSDWLFESYRQGAAPELTPINRMRDRCEIQYQPNAIIDFASASNAERDAIYKEHVKSDPYQPLEKYNVSSVHPDFNNGEMFSIRVRLNNKTASKTASAMQHYMRMLRAEAEFGILDPENNEVNSLQPALLAGLWALSSLHDNFSQDPNALDDPAFWILQMLNHSLSRNHCYKKMTPGKRESPHLAIPTTPELAVFRARNRAAARQNVEMKYKRMFRALHLMVVQKICLVLRTRFKRLHNIQASKKCRVDPTAFNKAVGFQKAHLNEAEESWRSDKRRSSAAKQTAVDVVAPAGQKKRANHEDAEQNIVKEDDRRRTASYFLQRRDLTPPICTTVRALLENKQVSRAKEIVAKRVNEIDECMALHAMYVEFTRRQTSVGAARFLREARLFGRHSSFCGENEAIYGCSAPGDWLAEGGKSTLVQAGTDDFYSFNNKISLTKTAVYGHGGTWDVERAVLLKLLRDLQDTVGRNDDDPDAAVQIPMLWVCAKEWSGIPRGSEIGVEELGNVCDYIARKESVRADMSACLVAFYDQMHHVVEAAFRFLLRRSLPGTEGRCALPVRASDDRVAQVARAHVYLMLSVAMHRNMRTSAGEPVFYVGRDGLQMANTRLWSDSDWVGFAIMTEIALSAESARFEREKTSVRLLLVPDHMVSRCGIVETHIRAQDTVSIIDDMAAEAEVSFGVSPTTSFIQFCGSFSGPRSIQMLRLNCGAYKYIRTDAKADDIARIARTQPWKGEVTQILPEERRLSTEFFYSEYETTCTQRGAQLQVGGFASAPPRTQEDIVYAHELFGSSDSESEDESNHIEKAARRSHV